MGDMESDQPAKNGSVEILGAGNAGPEPEKYGNRLLGTRQQARKCTRPIHLDAHLGQAFGDQGDREGGSGKA